MFAVDPEKDNESQTISQLLAVRSALKQEVDTLTSAVGSTAKLSDDAITQLKALHRDYERVKDGFSGEENAITANAQKRIDEAGNDVGTGMAVGAAVAAGVGIILTGGLGGVAAALLGLSPGSILGAKSAGDKQEGIEAERDAELAKLRSRIADKEATYLPSIGAAEANKKKFLAQLHTAEQRRVYFGIVAEILLDNGINIARQMNQFAHFNGISVDNVLAIEDSELRSIFDRMFKGQPKATDLDRLIALSETLANKPVVTPEIRTIKQFVNQVVIPNMTYFEILASFADDVRDKDLSTFPPLEILNQKPISLSGRIQAQKPKSDAATNAAMLEQAKAKVQVREAIEGSKVYAILHSSDLPHMQKMAALEKANEEEIAQYAGVFAGIEHAMAELVAKSEQLGAKMQLTTTALADGQKLNQTLDARVTEITQRNKAKQDAAKWGGYVRSGLAYGGAIALDLLGGGGLATTALAAGDTSNHGARALGRKLVTHAAKAARESMHSLSYAGGQAVSTHVENNALDDYMFSLIQQKVDVGQLQGELAVLGKEIETTKNSRAFQALMRDEAKRTMVAETLLLRSLIRNGYNNSLEFEELCANHGIASVDAFLAHYQGTRLGLALKKHCHGLADSNDMSVILAESNCLRGNLSAHDAMLKEYVEDVMKPNIGSFYSKASKMDVIGQNNLTGFGNDLHLSAELQVETARGVRLLMANEFGMSVVGREDVRSMFDFWLHRHGDRRLYDDKLHDGEMSDEYPEKRVSYVSEDRIERFVDMAKRSVASGRKSFPKIGDTFLRFSAHEYFLPQAVHTGGKDNIFTDYPESPAAYPMVNTVIREFTKQLCFSDLSDFRDKVGTTDEGASRLDNLVAQTFMDYFKALGKMHRDDSKLAATRDRLKQAANYDDYAPIFDRYAKNITRDALQHFDLFLELYAKNLEKTLEGIPEKERATLEELLESVKQLSDGKLCPHVTRPGTHEARLRAHDELHTGENLQR